jgi:MFS family permease
MRLSLWEGACYAAMVGLGDTYLLANVIRLGGTPLQQGLVVTLPLFLGGFGPLLALRLLARWPRRRAVAVSAALGQAVVLASLACLDAYGASSATRVIALAVLHQVCGQAAGTAWSSWFGDLVPQAIRGRYFARRNRGVHLATLLGLVVGGILLHNIEPASALEAARHLGPTGGRGFALIFSLAAAFRLGSVLLLSACHEPRFRGLARGARLGAFLSTARGSAAWKLLVTGAALQFVVYVASPYFSPFMLTELRFDYATYMLASVCIVAAKVALLPAWGRVIDQHGARSTFALAALLVALVPLPWIWAQGLGWVLVAQAMSGSSWAGHEVSYFTYVLESSYAGTRAHLFAAQSLLNGSAQLLGSLLGAVLLAGLDSFRTLFAISLVARLAVALCIPRLLPVLRGSRQLGRRQLLLRVIGLRAHGGLVHRPIEESPGEAGEDS